MDDEAKQTEQRKREHLAPFREGEVRAAGQTAWFEHVHLVHQALPEVDASEVDVSARFAGRDLGAPLMILGMTGGTASAKAINRDLARVAERLGIALGLGSQRAMLAAPDLASSYAVRDVAPGVFLAGNLGGVQLARTPIDKVRDLVARVGADALCIHLNPAQELVQPEGDRDFRGIEAAIASAVRELPVPILVKEVGAGIGRETAIRLRDLGVRFVDVGGAGGTSWVGVELKRRGKAGNADLCAFEGWGIPTAAAIVEVSDLGMEVVASGGIRTGLEVAKAIALGASIAGVAAPVLRAWFDGGAAGVSRWLEDLIDGLRTAMVLTGSRRLTDLRTAPRVLTGPLLDWMRQRVPDRAG